jgi:site-specific DNA-methyltransferase (adenine-specific)
VFLREIVKRLTVGLAKQIPDLTERVNHILTKQVYGIAITELTSLLARRSLYCSKFANGLHSVARVFKTEEGNVWFERTEHAWLDGKCKFCGASEAEYSRLKDQESHAYAFIHSSDSNHAIRSMFGADMRFDVVIGNPPYQLSDGGGSGTSAAPIYQYFVEQAKKLEPNYLAMVVPARWFAGGKGLDEFRARMLNDTQIRSIDDFADSSDVFPGVQIKGGVCYFLWARNSSGDVCVRTHDKGNLISTAVRPLLEPGLDVFIRYNEAIDILKKVAVQECGGDSQTLALPAGLSFGERVSVRRPFGLESTFRGKSKRLAGDVEVFRVGGSDYVSEKQIDDSFPDRDAHR